VIQRFVDKFMKNKQALRESLAKAHPENYLEIVTLLIEALQGGGEASWPDPKRIHVIDDGDYQGTLIFLIGESDDPPSVYWCITLAYGSCSSCDTLQRIRDFSDTNPTEEQIDGYMTLMLHCVQSMKEL